MKYSLVLIFALLLLASGQASSSGVRLKDIARIQDEKDSMLLGYGLVIGLSGTGDSARNKMTVQSLKNTLSHFGLMLDDKDIISRNVAAVMITAKISSFREHGDQFDISVSSIGDSRSLSGGTLTVTPLYGIDEKIYAFAQGQVTVGGYEFEKDNNSYQKNHATVGKIVKGGILERSLTNIDSDSSVVNVILNEPDYTTVTKIVNAIHQQRIAGTAIAVHPGKLKVQLNNGANKMEVLAKLENILVVPDSSGKVVINERTGTIVAGTDVVIGAVSIAHGNLKIEIDTNYSASQPTNGFYSGRGVQSLVIPDVDLTVTEEKNVPISMPEGTTVSELVVSLNKINLSTRDIITILQSIKTAGALHADLIIE